MEKAKSERDKGTERTGLIERKRSADGPKRATGPGPTGDPPRSTPHQESKPRSIREVSRLSCDEVAETMVSSQKQRRLAYHVRFWGFGKTQ